MEAMLLQGYETDSFESPLRYMAVFSSVRPLSDVPVSIAVRDVRAVIEAIAPIANAYFHSSVFLGGVINHLHSRVRTAEATSVASCGLLPVYCHVERRLYG